jgi:hypothetical protein
MNPVLILGWLTYVPETKITVHVNANAMFLSRPNCPAIVVRENAYTLFISLIRDGVAASNISFIS